MRKRIRRLTLAATMAMPTLVASSTQAADPTAEQALKLRPVQADVQFETPSAEDAKKCTVEQVEQQGMAGWIVRREDGQLLRRFLDTNLDNQIDQWCYYQNGVEVYRDVDVNFNQKADQYRWLGTEGMRWGIDRDEDSKIDQWKMISAEEVSSEVIRAIVDQDANRFRRLLITEAEIKSLGLDEQHEQELIRKVAAAQQNFGELVKQQKFLKSDAQWIHFGATRPGIVPRGMHGLRDDQVVYENVAAVVQQQGQHLQVSIGTMIQIGSLWRLIDLPQNLTDEQLTGRTTGYFFASGPADFDRDTTNPPANAANEKIQQLLGQLEQIDQGLLTANEPEKQARLNAQRADTLQALANATQGADRDTWLRQLAESLSAAAQSGGYDEGVDRLGKLVQYLKAQDESQDLIAFAQFRYLSADYALKVQQPKADFAKIQEQWLKQLESFVAAFGKSEDSAEAMLQLGIAEEFAGQEDAAIQWYSKVVTNFGASIHAKKAAGARKRLQSEGKILALTGTTLDGKSFDLSRYRNRTVVLHYWATWCEPCKQDMQLLKQLNAKYASKGLSIVGINVDSQKDAAESQVKADRLSWPQLFEEGGLESRLANELGILTLPAMFLIDANGRVVNRNLHAAELEQELQKLLK